MNPVSPAKLTYQENEFEMPHTLKQEIAMIRFREAMSGIITTLLELTDGEENRLVNLVCSAYDLEPTYTKDEIETFLSLLKDFSDEDNFISCEEGEKIQQVVEETCKLFATGKK